MGNFIHVMTWMDELPKVYPLCILIQFVWAVTVDIPWMSCPLRWTRRSTPTTPPPGSTRQRQPLAGEMMLTHAFPGVCMHCIGFHALYGCLSALWVYSCTLCTFQ